MSSTVSQCKPLWYLHQKFVEEVVDSEGKNVEKGLTYEDWFEMFEDFRSVSLPRLCSLLS